MRTYRTKAIATFVAGTASIIVFAQNSFAHQENLQAEQRISLGGETLFVLKSNVDLSKDAKTRADDSYDRLRFILNNPKLKGRDIQVKNLGDYGVKIVANDQLIVPIGAAEAEAHHTTPLALAKSWATHLRQVLPNLTARPDLFAKSYALTSRKTNKRR